jgi:hypothetical protein
MPGCSRVRVACLSAPGPWTGSGREPERAIGRPDLRFHDLRHSDLTCSAATGASVAEIMMRGGHKSPAAALRYQHSTRDRDRALADALAKMAEVPTITALPVGETLTDGRRTKLSEDAGADAPIVPFTSPNIEQSQRGSNPCLHLERAERIVEARPSRSQGMSFWQVKTAILDDR